MKYAKVKALRNCPSREAWLEQLERDQQPTSWTAHLEECRQCQLVLDQLAADAPLWQEACETLSMRFEELTHITDSIVPLAIEPSQSLVDDPMCEYELAQLQQLLGKESADSRVGTHESLRTISGSEPIATLGRYELEQLIGRGGMGLVFRAWDAELHRVVAVKTLSLALWTLPSARQRFVREGRAAAMLNHPHIVPLYDVVTDCSVPALVMQYIAGPTLDQWIQDHGPMHWTDALRIAWQLADALCAAHREGLVHRDIKPGNVLVEADGSRALLTDFGLVRAMDDASLTQSGLLAGTPHFMSPEQARGEEVDGRSDLFSLGALLYFAIAGEPPFRGRESMAVLNALCHVRHTPLSELDREVPIQVCKLVNSLLSKSPGDRPASSQAVRDQLRSLIDAQPRLRTARRRKSFTGKRWRLVACICLIAIAATMWLSIWGGVPKDQPTAIPYAPPYNAYAEASALVEADGPTMSDEVPDKLDGAQRIELMPRAWPELQVLSSDLNDLNARITAQVTQYPLQEVTVSQFDARFRALDSEITDMLNKLNK